MNVIQNEIAVSNKQKRNKKIQMRLGNQLKNISSHFGSEFINIDIFHSKNDVPCIGTLACKTTSTYTGETV